MTVPSAVFPVTGIGRHEDRIGSFEMALRDAGIAPYNLVPVSSVIPPDATVVAPDEGRAALDAGEITHCVLAREDTRRAQAVAAAVGVAIGGEHHGYAVEQTGRDEQDVAGRAERVATDLLDREPDRRFTVSAATTGEDGVWTTAVAAVVFVP